MLINQLYVKRTCNQTQHNQPNLDGPNLIIIGSTQLDLTRIILA